MALGNDVLSRLPAWSVDCKNRTFHMEDNQVQIFTFVVEEVPLPIPPTPEPRWKLQYEPQKRSSFNLVQKSWCYVADVSRNLGPMMSLGNVLNSETVFVAAAVFRTAEPRLLLSNPSPSVQVVYKDQRLDTAFSWRSGRADEAPHRLFLENMVFTKGLMETIKHKLKILRPL
ncbi:unnamed protein product [Heligmosomoides polygyrus]|uniref:CPSF_A domain-containing protein n=1 Tax=Heligmosomoides polygyrus TaxID=6339 RepID=A0A183FR23_HELPZ|nr:unnamed protein product [Heligmosomoides polygyrus]